MPTISSRPSLGWDEIASGHKAVVDDNTANVTKSLDYDELKKLVGTYRVKVTAATYSIIYPGRINYKGAVNTVFTLPDANIDWDGLPITIANNSTTGGVTLTINSFAGTPLIVLDPGMKYEAYWDNEDAEWTIY